MQLNDGVDHLQARATATHRLSEIEARIADLAAMRDALRALVCDCEQGGGL